MPGLDDSEPGIDKQKVIRALDEGEPDTAASREFGPVDEQEGPRGPTWLKYLGEHSDEVASLVILSSALVWIVGGVLAGNPIPVLIGAGLILPGVFALAQCFRS